MKDYPYYMIVTYSVTREGKILAYSWGGHSGWYYILNGVPHIFTSIYTEYANAKRALARLRKRYPMAKNGKILPLYSLSVSEIDVSDTIPVQEATDHAAET